MKFAAIVLCLALSETRAQGYWTETRVLTPEKSNGGYKSVPTAKEPETTIARWSRRGVPVDNNKGNYGDLIHRYRENGDNIFLREVFIVQDIVPMEQDIVWSVSIPGVKVTSVRVLNFGRERAYTLRIDVAGGDVQVIIRIPPLCDPRVMIEVYGFQLFKEKV